MVCPRTKGHFALLVDHDLQLLPSRSVFLEETHGTKKSNMIVPLTRPTARAHFRFIYRPPPIRNRNSCARTRSRPRY
jgi:hypothetical protein